jgi:hypothetical protein
MPEKLMKSMVDIEHSLLAIFSKLQSFQGLNSRKISRTLNNPALNPAKRGNENGALFC